jgi:hypothetical protein
MTPRLTWPQALAWRMERQLLGSVEGADAVEVVRRLCGVQAQVLSTAELAIRVRSASAPPGVVAASVGDGRLVRTWAMRGTLHLLTPEDGPAFLSLLASARIWEKPAWVRWAGMTPAVVAEMVDATREALDGGALPRGELIAAITARPRLRHLAGPLHESWGTALKPLAWQGELAFGPGQGGRATFQRPAASPRWKGLPPIEDAVPAALTAYLRAFGPATPANFGAWLSRGYLSKRRMLGWWDSVAHLMSQVEVDGEIAYVLADDLDSLLATEPVRGVRLLPGFDQWVLGPGTDDPHVVPPGRRAAVSRQSGWIAPLVVAGGVVRGTWKLEGDKVRIGWFAEAGRPPRVALADEVARLSELVGRRLSHETVEAPLTDD